MKLSRIAAILVFSFAGANLLMAQDNPSNEARPIQNDIRISSGEKFDFIFTRGLLVPGGDIPAASSPLIISSSGSYSIGLGFAIPLKKAVAIRFEPRLTWNSLNFQQTDGKTFPSDSLGNYFIKNFPLDTANAIAYERIRSFYAELPLGIRFNLARNEDDKVRLFTEFGFSGGYLISSALKARKGTGIDRVTIKAHDVPGLSRLRYGPYFRFGTNWIALHAFYRLPGVFSDKRYYADPLTKEPVAFPLFPKLELGFVIML